MPERRSRTLLWILIGGGAFFLFVLAVFSLVYLTLHAGSGEASFSGFGDRIGVVDLDGVILSPQPVVGELKKFAVVLEPLKLSEEEQKRLHEQLAQAMMAVQ